MRQRCILSIIDLLLVGVDFYVSSWTLCEPMWHWITRVGLDDYLHLIGALQHHWDARNQSMQSGIPGRQSVYFWCKWFLCVLLDSLWANVTLDNACWLLGLFASSLALCCPWEAECELLMPLFFMCHLEFRAVSGHVTSVRSWLRWFQVFPGNWERGLGLEKQVKISSIASLSFLFFLFSILFLYFVVNLV